MKTLKNHTLLYDKDCPVCATYTNAFIKTNMLDEFGRLSYEEGLNKYHSYIDENRSRNEIALINTENGDVKYGIDSLIYIITQKFTFLSAILNNKALLFILKKFYSLISYNRKIIATSSTYINQTCVPDFNIKYRILYMVIAAIFTSTVLLYYSYLLKPIVPQSNLIREYGVCFGQILFQGSILLLIKTKKPLLFDYLGNMMTVSLLGGILLLPSFIIAHYFIIDPMVYLAYFFAVVVFMFFNHQKRVKNIKAPVWLSYTWVLYRCLVLLIIL